ncbi:MAG: molybdopterin cofactor-binding domain-containing protein [Pseudomonadota bacterium]
MGIGKIARRTFLIGATAIAGGVAVGYYYISRPYGNPLEKDLAEGEVTFNPYIKIADDNTVTVITPRAEMGQGVHTSLAALVAEELDLTLADIETEHGMADWAYFNGGMLEDGVPFALFNESFVAESMRAAMPMVGKVLGLQVTGGSSSIKDGFDKMRQAGCATRYMLLEAAAKELGVDKSTLEIKGKTIVDPASGNAAEFGKLAATAAKLTPPSELVLREQKDWKLLGKSQPRVDIPDKVTGGHVFGIDVELPEMVHATVKMSPRFWAKAKSYDDTAALAVPGVTKVVPLQTQTGNGFGVIADNTWAAFKGAEALEVEWEEASYPKTSEALFEVIEKALETEADQSLRDDGSVETAFADAPREDLLEADYKVPWLAHACLEPMNATARWKDGKLTIWAPTQAPTLLQMVCSGQVGVNSDEVEVHITKLGGGFGRKGEVDAPIYAVELAKHTDGRPVKVTWSREEDTRHDTYRPAAMGRMKARVKEGELPTALDIHLSSPSIIESLLKRTFPGQSPAGPDNTMEHGAFDQPYTIPNYRVRASKADIPVPVGFWRSVGNSYNGWFHESFMDEIAEKAGKDPLEMRLELMKDHPAAIGALKKVAEMSGWGRDMPEGSGLGLAHVVSFGTWVAVVAEVTNEDDVIQINDVWAAAEIGTAIDPSIVKAQIMSGIVFGLSSAIGQEINFEDGEVVEGNFDEFDSMRMIQCPNIHVELLETYHKIGGAGEPGTPPSIPALANAIYAATGTRIRTMPLSHEIDFVS